METLKSIHSPKTLSIQSWLRPELTPVKSNCDFSRFKEDLDRISRNLRESWAENLAMEFALDRLPE